MTTISSAYIPRFGLTLSPKVLRPFDFINLGQTIINQNKVIYAACIASRIIGARSTRERAEVTVQDGTGWAFWYMANPVVQFLFAAGAVALLSRLPALKNIGKAMIHPLEKGTNPVSRFFKAIWDTPSIYRVISDKQARQRFQQIEKAAKAAGNWSAIQKPIEKLSNSIYNLAALTTAVGTAVAIGLMGFGIMQIKIAMSRRNIRQELLKAQKQKSKADEHKRIIAPGGALASVQQAPLSAYALPAVISVARNPFTRGQSFTQVQPQAPYNYVNR